VSANLIRKISNHSPSWLLRWLGNLWLPFFGAGIKVLKASQDFRFIQVCLKKRWYNSNYVGTQFGGSIYAMTDPFFMLMLIQNLGKEYIVWDKGAKVDFLKPGTTNLYAEFKIDQNLIDDVKDKVGKLGKYVFDLPVSVLDENQQVIAKIEKTIYVRKK